MARVKVRTDVVPRDAPSLTYGTLARIIIVALVLLASNWTTFLLATSPTACDQRLPRVAGLSLRSRDVTIGGISIAANNDGQGAPARARLPHSDRAATTVTAASVEFCTPGDGLRDASSDARAVALATQWDAINAWPRDRVRDLFATTPACLNVTMKHWRIVVQLPVICTLDPAVDTTVSALLQRDRWWGSEIEHMFLLSAGAASGSPLLPQHAAILRAAATKASPPRTLDEAAALLPNIESLRTDGDIQTGCSLQRPLHIDIGAHIGYFSLVMAASGCSIIAVEPLAVNVAPLWHSVLVNEYTDRFTVYKNAAHKDVRLVTLDVNPDSTGSSAVTNANVRELPARTDTGPGGFGVIERGVLRETVAAVAIDDLFDGSDTAPVHPFLPRRITPGDVASIKIDASGMDAAVLWGARKVIEAGLPPLIKMDYDAGRVARASGCDNMQLMTWLYGLGYVTYIRGRDSPLTLQQWQNIIIPMLMSGNAEELRTAHGITVVALRELFIVHSAARVPPVLHANK